ncbi:hypothetical protein F0919_01135 [Taibaiella lutea]|uniref:DUF5683 domain-containing protein n=1 Tax=Taibaiella lutea TaxID=2608001 RepID=A0A5M6CM53_9BACT|nr:DUF5683 domain-containing protein [Taibaiella lutea]KAA5536301.1 hypothetical protein F0919_01135 [Taibaiella lutea]
MNRALALFFFLIIASSYTFAQQKADSAAQKQPIASMIAAKDSTLNTVIKKDSVIALTPKKIGMYSALVPGWGQIYNKQYWKLPIIYIGLGAAAYFIYDNQKNYNRYRTEYAARFNGKKTVYPELAVYGPEELQYNIDYYQRNRDLTYILTGVGYALQIVDAVVFAHLKGFDISEDISFRVHPIVTPQGGYGFGLAMNF